VIPQTLEGDGLKAREDSNGNGEDLDNQLTLRRQAAPEQEEG